MHEHPKDPNHVADSPKIDWPSESRMSEDESRAIRESRLREGLPDSSLEDPVNNGPVPFRNLRRP